MNYNVFISSKSKGYHLMENVYDFLTKNGLPAFIASEELQKIGKAQYANAIDEALDESVHMVVVASSLRHINSKWVKYEWSVFGNNLKSGYRDGILLTILSGSIELKALPLSIRHQQSFHFDTYKKRWTLDSYAKNKNMAQKKLFENEVSEKCNDFGYYPIENLSLDEAFEFVITNKFSIPTKEEWEYATRGGQRSQGFSYAGSNNLDEVSWYRNNSESSTHPAGEKKPKELFLYDMSGNVWEWTEKPALSYATDIEAGGNIIIRRGGSWWHEAKNCCVSRRYASDHSKKTNGLGLRVVNRENEF